MADTLIMSGDRPAATVAPFTCGDGCGIRITQDKDGALYSGRPDFPTGIYLRTHVPAGWSMYAELSAVRQATGTALNNAAAVAGIAGIAVALKQIADAGL